MKLLFKVLLVCLLFTIFAPKHAYAKSFYFPKATIDITVEKDSSINVIEKRTVSFDGSFTIIYWDIPLKRDQVISNVSVAQGVTSYKEIALPDEARPLGSFAANRNGNTELL